jgi:hypothetical protein
MSIPKKPFALSASFLVFLMVLCGACQVFRARPYAERPSLSGLESVVVIGFRTSMFDDRISAETLKKMNAKLFEEVRKIGSWELISPRKARGIYSSLMSSEEKLTELEMLQKIGQTFQADAVLVGNLYRWRERVGSDHAADLPASVAFNLRLMSPRDGAILWMEKFDKTQQSLSQNLFEWDTFFRGSGRWMTAEKLAELGLEGMLGRMPINRK